MVPVADQKTERFENRIQAINHDLQGLIDTGRPCPDELARATLPEDRRDRIPAAQPAADSASRLSQHSDRLPQQGEESTGIFTNDEETD